LGHERCGDGHGFEVKLTPQQRAAVETQRGDIGKVYGPVCDDLLPNSRLVVDRFHVAKQLNDVVDDLRKKTTRKYKAQLSKAEQKGDQQQGPGDYQALLQGKVLRHALEPADPGPEPGVGSGRADHRRARRNHVRPEGRFPRVLHLRPEEPADFGKLRHFWWGWLSGRPLPGCRSGAAVAPGWPRVFLKA